MKLSIWIDTVFDTLLAWWRQTWCRHDFHRERELCFIWCPKCGELHWYGEKQVPMKDYREDNMEFDHHYLHQVHKRK